MREIDAATALETGLLAMGLAIAAGGAALLGGRLSGDLRRGRRRREPPPEAGSIPDERHRHVVSVAAR